MKLVGTICFSLLLNAQILAGIYSPPAGQNGSTAIYKDSTAFVGWATTCVIERGFKNIVNPSLGKASVGTAVAATDKSGINGVVSLGDGGTATLTFDGVINNGPGADFAVFENSFSDNFLELAFVEVSSDGINFFRFDAVSLTDTLVQTDGFGFTDATNLYNLAGKYRAQYGTPFDLDELAGISGLDINKITHIRIVDVIGKIAAPFTTRDAQNNPINDPWPTPFAASGFDLDAVGIIHAIPTSVEENTNTIQVSMYPNPSSSSVYFNFEETNNYSYQLTNLSGNIILSGELHQKLDISSLKTGIYFIRIYTGSDFVVQKIIKKS